MAKHDAEETPNFEQAYRQLEKIVRELDSGELSLDDLDRKFEEGMALAAFCSKRLEQVEQKVNRLIENARGELEREPFEIEGEE